MTNGIYLDYAATAPLDPRVRERMLAFLGHEQGYANPSSGHAAGQAAAAAVGQAACEVAALVNGDPEFVIWTSGATESDNLAVIGAARFHAGRGRHIVTAATEHKAVLSACAVLEQEGFEVTYLQPAGDGLIAVEDLAAALRPDTVLVSLMHANNETGVVQDIAAIGAVCRSAGVLFHTDAVQSMGKLPIDLQAQCIDLLTINAHKACGPKGIGALVLNPDTVRRVEPLLFGGGQQRGMRPGTLPVHQIAGMGETCRLARELLAEEAQSLADLRDRLWNEISGIEGILLNGCPERRLCSILTVSVTGVEGESLRYALGDLAVTSGSACNSASGEPSYVLRALGHSDALAEASIRFSLGRFTTEADVLGAAARFRDAVAYLRSLAPDPVAG